MKVLSNWRSVRLWESAFERQLHRRHSLRTHGLLIGSFTLLLTWALSSLVLRLGAQSLALRYLFTLSLGYIAYLLILRWWAQRLAAGRTELKLELPDVLPDAGTDTGYAGLAHADGTGLGDLAGGALEAAGSADEGALIVVPVLALFLIGSAIVLGAGALVLLGR